MFWKKFFKEFQPRTVDESVIEPIAANMVEVPPGSFLMGSNEGEDDERPIHNVLIEGFKLCMFTVTQKEWFDVMETRPWEDLKYVCIDEQCPAVNISWYDVRAFIEVLNRSSPMTFRLPTEAEWEYACRAGASSAFAHGALRFNLPRYAWYYDNAFKKGEMYAHKVGTRRPNKWGLFDMQGNVYEWCNDWFRRNYYNKSSINNPLGPIYGQYKVVRGGDWARTDYFLRIASRRHYSPHHRDSYLGFRLVLETDKNGKTPEQDKQEP